MSNTNPRSQKEYWNDRVQEYRENLGEMVLIDVRRESHELLVRKVLKPFANDYVLDVACGYGRFADLFANYEGVDFSEEMIKLAKNNHPDKTFQVIDVHVANPPKEHYDIIFEVISLGSMEMTAKEFYQRWRVFARKAVIVLELDQITIFPIYPL